MTKTLRTRFQIPFTALLISLVLGLASFSVQAADESAFSAQTSMARILDNPKAREVLAKYIPDVMADPQIEQARVISLGELATYVPELDRETMTKVLADLNALEA